MEVLQLSPIEEAITRNALIKRGRLGNGFYPNDSWPMMNSDTRDDGTSGFYSYAARFENVFPSELGINTFESWTDCFERINDRRPIALELMGNAHLLSRLGLPGVFVNWTPDYEEGSYWFDDHRVEINHDIENIPSFLPALTSALYQFAEDGKVDLIVWKGEGGLSSMLHKAEAFEYWWTLLIGLLRNGGSAFIQNPYYMRDGCNISGTLERFEGLMYTSGMANIIHDTPEGSRNTYIRIDRF